MIAIADSGTTKTSWLFVSGDKKYQYKTVGFNPYYQTEEDMLSNLKHGLIPNLEFTEKVEKIYFYGAGCELAEKCEEVARPLREAFPTAEVNVWHDLLAAARALFGDEAGLACISGTGSNTCLYDGKGITKNVHSLGLFLGDEGSGGYKGKLLIRAYIRESMPAHLRAKFEEKYSDRAPDILDNVYTKPFPSRYLASFVPFVVENISDPWVHQLAYNSFNELFENCVSRYDNYNKMQLGFIGSVAFYLKHVLEEVAQKHGMTVGTVIRNPLEALAAYHQSKGIMA